MKKLLALFLTGVMMVSLAACGGTADKDSTESSVTEQQKNSESEKKDTGKTKAPALGAKLTQESLLDYPISNPEDFTTNSIDEDTCKIIGYNGDDEVIVVPEEIDGKTVTEIGENAFFHCESRGIVLPDTVEFVDGYAFLGAAFEYIHFGSGLKRVENACVDNENLKQIIYPEGTEEISVLHLCPEVVALVIPESVTILPPHLFFADATPKAVVVTPEGSAAEAVAKQDGLPVVHDMSEIPNK